MARTGGDLAVHGKYMLHTMHESLTYNKVFDIYLLVVTCVNISQEQSECGEPIQQTLNVTRVSVTQRHLIC